MNFKRCRAVPAALATVLILAPAPVPAADVEAITKPSQDVTLSFVRAGRISEVPVKEGDAIKEGALLARQDDEAERIQLQQFSAQAADTTRIEAAEAELAQKAADLKKFEEAFRQGAATDWEVEHARLSVRTAELALKTARFENEQNRLRRDEAQMQIERLRLISPIAGQVDEVVIEPGESAQALAQVIRVVRTDPLLIDVPVPLAQARHLKRNQAVHVGFPDASGRGGKSRAKGRIQNISTVADAASDTLRVRVEVPNPDRRPAGERVFISFSEPRTAGR